MPEFEVTWFRNLEADDHHGAAEEALAIIGEEAEDGLTFEVSAVTGDDRGKLVKINLADPAP